MQEPLINEFNELSKPEQDQLLLDMEWFFPKPLQDRLLVTERSIMNHAFLKNLDLKLEEPKKLFPLKYSNNIIEEIKKISSTILSSEDKIKEIITDIEIINKQLKDICDNFDVNCNLYLVGGALRDLIINKKNIKDLDILVNFNFKENFCDEINLEQDKCEKFLDLDLEKSKNKTEIILKKKLKNKGFKKNIDKTILDGLDSLNLKDDAESIIGEYLLSTLFNKDYINNIFNRVSIQEGKEYHLSEILSVIKINNKYTKHNIDLLISEKDVNQFVKRFDFNICKIYMDCMSLDFKEKDSRSFLNGLIYDNDFIVDLNNKFLTCDMDMFLTEDIKKSMSGHFIKLKQKYPDYKIQFNSSIGNDKEKKETMDFCINFESNLEQKLLLDNLLIKKENKNSKTYNKI